MEKLPCVLVTTGVISLILGTIVKILWYMGILTFLPFGIKGISYIAFANAMFLLSIAINLKKLLDKKE